MQYKFPLHIGDPLKIARKFNFELTLSSLPENVSHVLRVEFIEFHVLNLIDFSNILFEIYVALIMLHMFGLGRGRRRRIGQPGTSNESMRAEGE